jgi:hypothetical protein
MGFVYGFGGFCAVEDPGEEAFFESQPAKPSDPPRTSKPARTRSFAMAPIITRPAEAHVTGLVKI